MGATDPLGAARQLAPELSARAQEAEEARTMPRDLVEHLRSARLFHLMMPEALGGLQCDPLTVLSVIEEVARADGSAGWTVFIGNSSSFVAWLEPDVAKEVVAPRPDFIGAGVFAPTGTARTNGDRQLLVDGRWVFNSGCLHADWFTNGVIVMDGEGPRLRANGLPDWRFAFIPSKDVEIIDTWHVSGLCGTGSHDAAVAGAVVDEARTIAPFFEPARFDGALYRLPFPVFVVPLLCGFVLGVARRTLDEVTELAGKKSRGIPPGPTLAEDDAFQVELSRLEADVRSARAYVVESLGAAWETVCNGDDMTMPQRSEVLLAVLNMARRARQAVDQGFALAGGGSLFDSSPIQRCARDMAAGTQHLFFNLGRWKTTGRVLLGRDPETFLL
jgi:alkylation response protein AidB-like acyl-CoA dehydrogenase